VILLSRAAQMDVERQNRPQAQPEEIDEGVTLQLNIDHHIKTDPPT
jgi:hypothetical protein